jgi:hypothetical protein
VHMGTSAPSIFRILKFLKSDTFMSSKIMRLNILIDIYKTNVCKKVLLKIHCILGNIKKTNF